MYIYILNINIRSKQGAKKKCNFYFHKKAFPIGIYCYRRYYRRRYWVNQSCTRIGARESGGLMSLKVWTMANRQTRSSRAWRAATSSRAERARARRRRSQTEWQITKSIFKFPAWHGVQLENSISATDETLGRRSCRRLFSRFWRPIRYPAQR